MSISELYNIRRTLRKKQVRDLDLEGDQEEGGRVQVRADPSTSFLSSEQPSLRVKAEKAATSRKTRICNICYVEQAKYTCPSCNSPYCSLTCFRSKAHVGCSSDFSLKTLKEDGRVSGTRVGEEERLRMLDILKRLETNDQGYHDHMEDDDDVDEEQVEDEGQEEGEEERLKLLESMDLDEATPEQLLSLLSPKERERFQRAISDPKKAQSLMEHLERGAQGLDLNTPSDSEHRSDLEGPELISANSKDPDSTPLPGEPKLSILNRDVGKFNYESRPWWQEGGAEGQPFLSFGKSQARFEGDHGRIDPFDSFSKALRKALASQQLSSNPSSSRSTPSVDLAYNLVTILMTYAYILRYLDIPSLSSLLPKAKPQKLEDAKQKGSETRISKQKRWQASLTRRSHLAQHPLPPDKRRTRFQSLGSNPQHLPWILSLLRALPTLPFST
ncbi:hypothetical protein IE53DRAFT_68362 [Violaceomyces palustris]|uniref:Uncharacterized protein n=1 Tax=Violaceomyces palustris TaxID=1673888 RepID=A0ACD0NYT7_9BASI|nr:hypothetical protein IE53DRAFT_68362 [Violaceomyces palustris]